MGDLAAVMVGDDSVEEGEGEDAICCSWSSCCPAWSM